MKRNVYDFDGTIYAGDSTVDFYKYCVRRYPAALLPLPVATIYFIGCKLHLCSKTRFKEVFYRFLRRVPQVDAQITFFWEANAEKIYPWYLQQKEETDMIISASPEFLLAPICEKLNVRLIASRVDKHTGKTTGENCRGEEKVKRLMGDYPDCEIGKFYSDSRSDAPLAALAQDSYFVTKHGIEPW